MESTIAELRTFAFGQPLAIMAGVVTVQGGSLTFQDAATSASAVVFFAPDKSQSPHPHTTPKLFQS